MKVGKYVVIHTCGSEDGYIEKKGVNGIYCADTFEQSKKILNDIVEDCFDLFDIDFKIEKNIPYDDDLCECDRIEDAAYFWGNTKAWIRANLECWERVEIFEYDEEHKKFKNLSMP